MTGERSEDVKVCVITGANAGIGKATAQILAGRGWRVVMLCRSAERGEAARAEIATSATGPDPELVLCDLADRPSIAAAAEAVAATAPRLDVLINNAGAYFPNRRETPEGLEMTFAVNHLGPMLLTHLLREPLRAADRARIVNLSSRSHREARIDFDDLQRARRRYNGYAAYADSKLCNIWFSAALARRLEPAGITVNAVHPGVIATEFAQDEPGFFNRLFRIGKPFLGSPERGAATSVHVATSDEGGRTTGAYWERRRVRTPSKTARDEAAAERLWSVSVGLLGLD